MNTEFIIRFFNEIHRPMPDKIGNDISILLLSKTLIKCQLLKHNTKSLRKKNCGPKKDRFV